MIYSPDRAHSLLYSRAEKEKEKEKDSRSRQSLHLPDSTGLSRIYVGTLLYIHYIHVNSPRRVIVDASD